MTIKLFEFDHPKHGYYSVWYDQEMNTYGISKSSAAPSCALVRLGAPMQLSPQCLDRRDSKMTSTPINGLRGAYRINYNGLSIVMLHCQNAADAICKYLKMRVI